MENRKLIYLFGLLFSIVFGLVYYLLFHTFLTVENTNTLHLYYNQVGLYKSEENAQKVINSLKEQQIDAYIFPQEDVNAVICGVHHDEAITKSNGDTLTGLGMKYIEKTIETNNQEVIDAYQSEDFTKALELIKNESKGNESTGTSS